MKKILLSFLMAMAVCSVFAQNQSNYSDSKHNGVASKKARKVAPFYIGFSGGVNNPGGVLGLDVSYRATPNVSIDAGIGGGTWGTKVYIGAKYYLNPYRNTWAFGGGFSHCKGETNFTTTLRTDDGSSDGLQEQVTLNEKPQNNFFLGAYRYWNMGRGSNKCYLELGWSVPLAEPEYSYYTPSGYELTSVSKGVVKLLSPGGLMLGFGFNFGLGKSK